MTTAVHAFLNSIARDYPWGVPMNTAKPILQSARIAFVYVAGEDPAEKENQLLEAAITKGMKLSLAQAIVHPLKKGESCSLAEFAAGVIVVLGEETWSAITELRSASKEVHEHRIGKKLAIRSQSTHAILHDPEAKRLFWNDLKTVMAKIS